MSVYFAERDGLIKIGFSRHPVGRAAHLKATLLATIAGDLPTERQMHLLFDEYAVGREWFVATPSLCAFIDILPKRELPDAGSMAAWPPVVIRMPLELRKAVQKKAALEERSMAAAIRYALRLYVESA